MAYLSTKLHIDEMNKKKCYILRRVEDNSVFVTTNKDYALETYNSGRYIYFESQLIEPKTCSKCNRHE